MYIFGIMKKEGKNIYMKKLAICVIFLLLLFLFGCQKSDLNNDEIKALNSLNKCSIMYQDDDNELSVTKNIIFSKPSDINCEIEISNENAISKNGIVTRQLEDVNVDIKFIVSVNDQKFEKTFKVIVKKLENSQGSGDSGSIGGKTGSDDTLSEADFTGLEQGATPIIDGWTLNVSNKGAYNTGWLSFRNNGEYIISDTLVSTTGNIMISFTYYMNNIGKTGNSSSKIKFSVLDKDDQVIDDYLSEELNQLGAGEVSGNINYAKTLSAMLSGKGEIKVKVEFVKDGGGNIGFGSVVVKDMHLEG